eukprot:2074243-Pyramimonas_sp.AAC.1
MNETGTRLFNFAAVHHLEIATTIKDQGSDSFTHIASKGQRRRLDYIEISSDRRRPHPSTGHQAPADPRQDHQGRTHSTAP